VRDSRLKVRPRILERGKKKKIIRKARGKSQRRSLLNHEGTETLNLCVFVVLWLSIKLMVRFGLDTCTCVLVQVYAPSAHSTTELR